MPDTATCERCGQPFELSKQLRARYPGWTPRLCPSCYAPEQSVTGARASRGHEGPSKASRTVASRTEAGRTVASVLDRYHEGPTTGVFTDGSAQPNPGPGGWGAVYVVDDQVVVQDHGHEPFTTNNRMELYALVRGCDLVPSGTAVTIYTDSKLAFDTITKWAPGWEKRGWKRKTGDVQNVELVRELYQRIRSRPELRLAWIPGHAGYRWNEYADALSTAYLRDEM